MYRNGTTFSNFIQNHPKNPYRYVSKYKRHVLFTLYRNVLYHNVVHPFCDRYGPLPPLFIRQCSKDIIAFFHYIMLVGGNFLQWILHIIVFIIFSAIYETRLSDITVQNHFDTKRSVATLFRFVAYFGCVRIEDSSGNRFVLNGIQRIACFILFFYIVPETFCTVTSCTHEAIRYTL